MADTEQQVTLKWVGSTLMLGKDSRGRTFLIGSDKTEQDEWIGAKASDLLIISAAACSTFDIVQILKKQREPLEAFDVMCTSDQLPDPPYTFTAIHLHYIACGNINPERLEKAIRLAEDKYCSVISTLRKAIPVTSDFEIRP